MYINTFKRITQELPALFAFSLAVLITLFGIQYVLLPQYQEFISLKKESVQYKARISNEEGASLIKAEMNKTHDLLKAKYSSMISGLGDPADLSGLLQMLIDKAKKADINFVKMQPQTSTSEGDYLLYPVLLESKTSYHALGQFVASLESIPHMVKIERFAITADSPSKIDIKLLVTCYLQKS